MLPSIDLKLTDISAFKSDSATLPQGVSDAESSTENFAGLLHQPLPAPEPGLLPEKGRGLPDVGKLLPPDGSRPSLAAELIVQSPDTGGVVNPLFSQAKTPGVPPLALNEISPLQAATPTSGLQNAAQLLIGTQPQIPVEIQAATRTQGLDSTQSGSDPRTLGQHQSPTNAQTQTPVLTAEPIAQQLRSSATMAVGDILQPKSATTDSTLPLNETQMRRANGPAGKTPRTALLDNLATPSKLATTPDLDNIRDVRTSISAAFSSPFATVSDRLQGFSQAQSFNVASLNPAQSATHLGIGQFIPAPSAPAAPITPSSIDIPLQDPAWGEALGDRVLFMSGQKIHQAEIKLNPAEMGPITIRVSVGDRAADVSFTAQHLAARDAIELAMPRLRELFSENGLTLGNTSVEEHSVGQEESRSDAQEVVEDNGLAADESSLDDAVAQQTPIRQAQGLVDTFV